MKTDLHFLRSKLIEYDIRPSYQRIRILEYFYCMEGHPTVDEIFAALASDIPGLSRTTIYNTVKLFIQVGLLRELNIHENEMRYDMITRDHGHFKCVQCGNVINFEVDIQQLLISGLGQYQIKERDVLFKGICPKCQADQA
jgi:Fur family transcriptional regulator, peroxide stress response regulator